MKKIIYKSQAIQSTIIILAILFLLSLFPFRVWSETVTVAVPPETGGMIGPIDDERMLVQSFTAQYDHLDTVQIFLGEESGGASFYFRMLDPKSQMLLEEEVVIDNNNLPGFYEILVDQELAVGEQYFFILQGKASYVYVGCEYIAAGGASSAEAYIGGTLYYMDNSMEGLNLAADYRYNVPLRKGKVLLLGAVVLAAAMALTAAVRGYYRRNQVRDRLITVERAFKYVMNPLVGIGTLIGLVAVLQQAFGGFLLDNTFFFVSILLLAGILFYGINHNRDGQEAIVNFKMIKDKWPDFLQSVFLACAIGACCEYMSGLYDIHHTVAERKEVIFFALAIAVMFGRKQIWNLINVVYLAAAGFYGYRYYTENFTEELKELDAQALKLTVWAGMIAGFVIVNVLINLCRQIIKKEMSKPAYWYGGLLAVFFTLLMVYRNERWWPVALVVSFAVYYLQYGASRKQELLLNICRGIALHFAWATGYALLHRPFVTYRTARYTHIFHTVTITATYLTMVECAALVILLVKFRKSRKLKDLWKELVFFGVVSSYMLFTMARTGFFAVAVAAVFAVILMAGGKGVQKLKQMGIAAGMMIAATVVCFPVTFMVQRTVPALVSEPVLFDFESYPDDIMRGRKAESLEYMRVGRFIDVFADKIFSMSEGTFDVYGEIAEYNESHGITTVKATEQQAGTISGQGEETSKIFEADHEENPESAGSSNEPEVDYTNGRMDIFRSYLDQLNMTGHKEMGALLQDGSIATHAHNIYLQFAYDHGIPMGILFVIVGIATFIKACIYYHRNKESESYAALPAVVTATVAVAGMVEWIFHFSNPSGFILMLIIAPLLFGGKGKGI